MGSQYIRGTTDSKTRNKKNKRYIQIRFWGVYRYFTLIYRVFISERGKFSTGFYTISTIEEVDG